MDDHNQTDIVLQELTNNRAVTTMEWTSQQEVHLPRNTIEQHPRSRRSIKDKKKKKKRKKKKTWLIVNNDNDINTYYRFVQISFIDSNILCLYYIRPSKYLQMPYKLLHHTLCVKLQHSLIRNKERFFVLSRLRLLDELCYMDSLYQLWQSYYCIGVQHRFWPVSQT